MEAKGRSAHLLIPVAYKLGFPVCRVLQVLQSCFNTGGLEYGIHDVGVAEEEDNVSLYKGRRNRGIVGPVIILCGDQGVNRVGY